MKDLLVMSFTNPFSKPRDGAKNDVITRIMALKNCKCNTDLVVFNNSDDELIESVELIKQKYNIREFYQFDANVRLLHFFSKYPLSSLKRYSEECVRILRGKKYDAVIYEGEHMALYRFNNIIESELHILRQHDIESNYRRELSRSAENILEKCAQFLESVKYWLLEKGIDKRFDKFLFISNDEMKIFNSRFMNCYDKFVYMPPSTTKFSDVASTYTLENTMLYFGNLELNNNFLSILWFIEEVFPLILKQNGEVKLRIIGKVNGEKKKKLEAYSSRVEVLGYVDDLDMEIKNATLLVLPVLYGAGVKVKVIDALSYGQLICANSKTIEGTKLVSGEHLFVEDNSINFAKLCNEVIKKRQKYIEIAEKGLEFVRINHSIESQTKVLAFVCNCDGK